LELASLLSVGVSWRLLEEWFHRLAAHVAAADEPFVIRFDCQHRDQANQARVVGEDSDDVGTAADFAVEALQRVGIPYEAARCCL
jgi:hypothetical protein